MCVGSSLPQNRTMAAELGGVVNLRTIQPMTRGWLSIHQSRPAGCTQVPPSEVLLLGTY